MEAFSEGIKSQIESIEKYTKQAGSEAELQKMYKDIICLADWLYQKAGAK